MMKIIIPCALKEFALIWSFLTDTHSYPKSTLKIGLWMNMEIIGKTYENGKYSFNIVYRMQILLHYQKYIPLSII